MSKVASRPNRVDVSVGNNVRLQRTRHGLEQSFLAEKLGISLVEFQDCELGVSRFGAVHLMGLARLMDVSPSEFFADIPRTDDMLGSAKSIN